MPTSSLPQMNRYRCMSRRVESKPFLFIELKHNLPFYFHPYLLDNTLYVSSLVSLVSLLAQPMAKQDKRLALLRCKPSGSSLALVEDNLQILSPNISVLFSKLSPYYC